MQLNIIDQNASLTVADRVFACEYNEALLHQVVIAYQAGGRAGTVGQKTRAEVKVSGRKPWRQKGLGRARAGSAGSPLWRGGGVTFAAKPQDYRQKVNKKMYRHALRVILSEQVRQQRFKVIQELAPAQPKTQAFLQKLESLSFNKGLIITATSNENLFLSVRNVPVIDYCTVAETDPVQLILAPVLLVTVEAVKQFEEWLA